jgi:alpha-L-fucosidase
MYGFEDGWKWFPGESDAKGTDQGWFWHPNEKNKSAERLFQMYLETVGRNATLILNLPPDRSGRLPAADVAVLKSLGKMLKQRLGHDLAPEAHIEVSAQRTAGTHRNYNAANLTEGSTDTYWTVNDGTTAATITLAWHKVRRLHYVMLMEYIRKGQRIKRFQHRDQHRWQGLGETGRRHGHHHRGLQAHHTPQRQYIGQLRRRHCRALSENQHP